MRGAPVNEEVPLQRIEAPRRGGSSGSDEDPGASCVPEHPCRGSPQSGNRTTGSVIIKS